jgi:DNA-binding CsgD family transcriptional regulator
MGNWAAVGPATDAALTLAVERDAAWLVGQLALWRRRAGIDEPAPSPVAEPYALELAGRAHEAAEAWRSLGCPYEAALALGHARGERALRQSLDDLQALGARPAAAIVARRLREQGARGLARGPRSKTQANPAQLTRRQLEVLTLLADGLRNSTIADRLFVSTRTVDHHVSAILGKLGVESRGQAAAEARRLGLLEPR